MRFSSIIMKLRQVGFDSFYQAGFRSRFHPMNIVAENCPCRAGKRRTHGGPTPKEEEDKVPHH